MDAGTLVLLIPVLALATGRRLIWGATLVGLAAGALLTFWLPRRVPETPGSPGTIVAIVVLWVGGGGLMFVSLLALLGALLAKPARGGHLGIAGPLLWWCATLSAQETGPLISVGAGYHSSDQETPVVVGQLSVPFADGWALTPTVRTTTLSPSLTRVHVALTRWVGSRRVRPYFGVGVSHTRERPEVPLHPRWGAVFVAGVDGVFLPGRWEDARLRSFAQLDVFTHHFATGQGYVGFRLRLGG